MLAGVAPFPFDIEGKEGIWIKARTRGGDTSMSWIDALSRGVVAKLEPIR